MHAISHAHRVLDWQEHTTEDEMPPQWMWPFDELIVDWFDQVRAERDQAHGGGAGRDSDTTVPMMENELARGRR